jgi:hypothetical protein
MKFLGLNNGPLRLPASYASPGSAKLLDLDTPDCPRSRSLRAGTLCPPFLGLTLSGGSNAAPFSGMAEFGTSQVYMFRTLGNQNGVSEGSTPCGFYQLNPSGWTVYTSWAGGVAKLITYLSNGQVIPFSVGQSVTVSGVTPAAYNGTWTLTGVSQISNDEYQLTFALGSDPGTTGSNQGTLTIATPVWGTGAWSSNAFDPNADAWVNYPGPAPGTYPNRPNYGTGQFFTPSPASFGQIATFNVSSPGTGYIAGFSQGTLTGGRGTGGKYYALTTTGSPTGGIATAGVQASGWGYHVGDVLTCSGDTYGGSGAVLTVASLVTPPSFSYPSWTITSAAFPHTGSGSQDDPVWGIWNCPATIIPDTYQLSVTLSWGWSGLGYWAMWGKSVSLSRPWPDPMSLNCTLPFVGEIPLYAYLPPGFSWAGSSISLTRISKPSFPYH